MATVAELRGVGRWRSGGAADGMARSSRKKEKEKEPRKKMSGETNMWILQKAA